MESGDNVTGFLEFPSSNILKLLKGYQVTLVWDDVITKSRKAVYLIYCFGFWTISEGCDLILIDNGVIEDQFQLSNSGAKIRLLYGGGECIFYSTHSIKHEVFMRCSIYHDVLGEEFLVPQFHQSYANLLRKINVLRRGVQLLEQIRNTFVSSPSEFLQKRVDSMLERDVDLKALLTQMEMNMEAVKIHAQCAICKDILVRPCVIRCGHVFCSSCLDGHRKYTKNSPPKCPICKRSITDTDLTPCFQFGDLLSAIYKYWGKVEDKIERQEMEAERQDIKTLLEDAAREIFM